MRFFIELSYNGKNYHGWQIQPNAVSVQETVENALSLLLGEDLSIVGAGRTDTGVHAKQMFAHFDTNTNLDSEQLVFKLNSFLPPDIAIHSIFEVQPEVHARFNATSRTYEYKIATKKDVFTNDLAYKHPLSLDIMAMNKACGILLAYTNFECFSKTNTDVKTFECNITEAYWKQNETELIFTITADRFLRNMVRAIVGTLINIGLHKLAVEDLHTIIKSKDRGQAGYSVPAHGLYLKHIEYPKSIRRKSNG